jgi:small subunit ribosomal protein S8e
MITLYKCLAYIFIMAVWHLRSKRKPTSGIIKRSRKKRRFERGTLFLETRIGQTKRKIKSTRGGNTKIKLFSIQHANVSNPATGKITSVKIISVEENPANPHYVRRNIITKGAVIKTEIGLAKVTSRPCQDGIVNAVLIEEKK